MYPYRHLEELKSQIKDDDINIVGELDGGGISYLRREWEETHDLSPEKQQLSKTIMVPQVVIKSMNIHQT